MARPSLKPLYWIGSALKDLRGIPEEVKDGIGYALELVQRGGKPANAKPLKGFRGASVLEIVEDYAGATWRAVYTVEIADAIYVLHFFQKKSKKGIATPKQDIDLIKRRLREARDAKGGNHDHEDHQEQRQRLCRLGVKNPEEHALKAELVRQIAAMLDEGGI